MFVETNALSDGINTTSVCKKKTRKVSSKLPPADQTRFVLNAIISQHGYVAFYVTERRLIQEKVDVERRQQNVPITPYQERTSVAFKPETAFESDTGFWILDIGGTVCHPKNTDKFIEWIKQGFLSLKNDPDLKLDQPPREMELTRIF